MDDTGLERCFSRDSPALVQAAVTEAVRRWQMQRVDETFPSSTTVFVFHRFGSYCEHQMVNGGLLSVRSCGRRWSAVSGPRCAYIVQAVQIRLCAFYAASRTERYHVDHGFASTRHGNAMCRSA